VLLCLLLVRVQVRRPLPESVLLGVLLDAHILGIEMPQERLIRSIQMDFERWQVREREGDRVGGGATAGVFAWGAVGS
jgi:hypothetical protein